MQPEEIKINAGSATLAGRLFRPASDPVAVVVLNGATGAPQSFYRHFAAWLAAERGMACLTYDYRDFGASASGSLRKSEVLMSDWALIDQPAARAAMRQIYPSVPLWVIGHSLGGLLMPMQDGLEDIDHFVTVASGRVHVSGHPWPYQALARLFWFGHVPALTRVLGYMPGRLVGFGADLPASLYWQWRAWCTDPEFYFADPMVAEKTPHWPAKTTTRLIAITDDPVCPPNAVDRLASLYGPRAVVEHVEPKAFGLRSVGHLQAFSRKSAALWPTLVEAAAPLRAAS